MKRKRRNLLACISAAVLAGSAAAADVPAEDAASWYLNRSPEGSKMTHAIAWENTADKVMVADAIVYPEGLNTDWITVPRGAAQVFMVYEPEYRSPFAVILQFSDAAVHCMTSVGLFGVDSGTGSFLTPDSTAAIDAYLPTLAEGWSLYDGLWYDQSNEDKSTLFVLNMPDGNTFPAFSTGGDGGFQVFAFHDKAGATIALSTAFWQVNPTNVTPPPTCPQ